MVCCEHGNERSCSIKRWCIFDQLGDCHMLATNCSMQSVGGWSGVAQSLLFRKL